VLVEPTTTTRARLSTGALDYCQGPGLVQLLDKVLRYATSARHAEGAESSEQRYASCSERHGGLQTDGSSGGEPALVACSATTPTSFRVDVAQDIYMDPATARPGKDDGEAQVRNAELC